jgi:hypothetical protein
MSYVDTCITTIDSTYEGTPIPEIKHGLFRTTTEMNGAVPAGTLCYVISGFLIGVLVKIHVLLPNGSCAKLYYGNDALYSHQKTFSRWFEKV